MKSQWKDGKETIEDEEEDFCIDHEVRREGAHPL